MGTPEVKTIFAASGSTRMLNSAAGVQLPVAMPPPMRLMRAILPFSSGCASSSAATFVCGPVATMVTGSLASRRTFAISSGAGSSDGAKAGSGSAGPSRPDSPWTEGAFITSFSSGCGQPLPTGASSPMSVQTRRAL